MLARLQQGKQQLQSSFDIADQADFHGITQADADWIKIDLNATRLTGLGHEFDVGERAAGDQKAIAIFHRVLRRFGSEQTDGAGGVWTVIGNDGFSEQRFYDGRADLFRHLFQLRAGLQSSAASEDDSPFSSIQDGGGVFQIDRGRDASGVRGNVRNVVRDVAWCAAISVALHFQLLKIDGDGDVGDAAISERGAASERRDIFHVLWSHAADVVHANVGEELVKLDILLRVRVHQIVKLQTRDGEHRLAIEFSVVKSVKQMDSTRTRSCEAASEFAGVLGVGAGHESGGFFVANLDESNRFLAVAQGLHDSVDAVARQSEDHVHAPSFEGFDQNVRGVFGHSNL